MIVIAVDGTAASGKGTLARKLAQHYNLAYLDSGALYRAVALRLLKDKYDPADAGRAVEVARALDTALLNDPDLRSAEVGRAASIVAAIGPVRGALVDMQRRFASQPPGDVKGSILDGRDIGTVICSDAPIKLFVDADAETRAHRRFLELSANARAKGHVFDLREDDVLEDIQARDKRDKTRAVAPLKLAEDAHLLDSTNLSIEATFETACEIVDRVLERLSQQTP